MSAILVAAVVASCQAGGPYSSPVATVDRPTDVPSAAHPTGSGPAATVELGPAVMLELEAGGPIVRSTDGPKGHPYANPAAAALDQSGGYVLFIVWFGADPGDQIVTVATSDDGRSWRLGKTAIYTDLGMDLAHPGPGPVPAAAVQLDDGTWLLYGWAAHASDPTSFTSWRASAPRPEGPWTLDRAVVLAPGGSTEWDGQTAAVGAVQHTAAGATMWYEGQGPGSGVRGDIGLATSSDGLSWQKWDDPATTSFALADSDPVIHRGICGPETALAAYQPEVQARPGGFMAAFGAYGLNDNELAVFGATSPDGRTWRCGSAAPLLRTADIPGGQGIHALASIPLDGERMGLIIESLGDGHSDLWLATMEVAR